MFDYGDDWLGCGVDGHGQDCLCDVHITSPLPPLSQCLSDGVGDMWMGRQLCRIKDYGRPWTNESMLDYFTDLEQFYDSFHEQSKRGIELGDLSEVEMLEFDDKVSTIERWKIIRENLRACIDRFPNPLGDIVRQLGLTAQEAIDAMTTAKCGGDWDYDKLNKLDDYMSARTPVIARIARYMGISKETARGLNKYWIHRRSLLWRNDTNPAQTMLHDLCRNTTMSASEIVNKVYETHGVKYSKSNVSQYRSRHVKNQ